MYNTRMSKNLLALAGSVIIIYCSIYFGMWACEKVTCSTGFPAEKASPPAS